MVQISLFDSNFPHQQYLTPYLTSDKIIWVRDGKRRKINVYTDNFIKNSIIDIPNDGNINVCVLLEPLTNPPWTDIYDYIQTDFEKFDLIITHNLDKLGHLIESRPDKFYYSTKCITTSWLEKSMIGLHPKSKKISMPFSFKNFSEGHRIRHLIYEKYKNKGIIDFFGDGDPNFKGEFRNCFIDYKYIIVCENTLQTGFNSEKLNDAFLTGCIPLYWGSKIIDLNYDTSSVFYFSPKKNIVNFEFEESLENLDKLLEFITNNDPYTSLIESVKQNYEYSLNYFQTENNIYEILKSKNIINENSDFIEIKDLNILNRKTLTELGKKYNTDKSWYHTYTDFYEIYFSGYTSPRIIEIGTAGHGSTQMFLEYFGDCKLVGMDIQDYSSFEHPNFRFVNGNQTNIEDLKKCVENEDLFDIILDDGGHTMKQQQLTFGYLSDFLNNDSLYIIEDIHTSFNQGFIEGDCEVTTYDMVKKISKKELPFSNYISLDQQQKIIDRVMFVDIFAKNPNDLSDSVTCIIKFN